MLVHCTFQGTEAEKKYVSFVLGVKMNSSHTPKTILIPQLGVLFKISNDHQRRVDSSHVLIFNQSDSLLNMCHGGRERIPQLSSLQVYRQISPVIVCVFVGNLPGVLDDHPSHFYMGVPWGIGMYISSQYLSFIGAMY